MSEPNKFAETFRQEAEELLATVEDSVLDMEQNPEDSDAVNRLFRAMHTIKGSGSMFGFEEVAAFTHHVETALDKVRNGQKPVTQELIDLILASRDQIVQMLEAAQTGAEVDQARADDIITSLNQLMGESGASQGAATTAKEKKSSQESLMQTYRVRFEPSAHIFASGMDPILLLEDLEAIGDCCITAFTDRFPDLQHFDPEMCYIYWEVILVTNKPKDVIDDVFIFVEGDSKVSVELLAGDTEEDDVPKLGEILVSRGDAKHEDVQDVLTKQNKIGELLVKEGKVSREKIDAALKEQNVVRQQKKTESINYIKVASDKLDRLINLVGELVITQAQLTDISENTDLPILSKPVEDVERLTAELRDSVLNIRMMPIGSTFNRFRRLVRDLSHELGKQIDMVTDGAETELDKTVIERLGDPLVHLIRNSIDHGIESPETRRKAGKPEQGTIELSASHRGASVVITITDDGKGLDADKIFEKAVNKGLIQPDAELSLKEKFNLIFMPGFSTAESVTSVSGRGVGMDVVRREIEALRGTIDIESEVGKKTVISLSLPLTLAIIDGLLVDVGNGRYVVPVSMIEECLEMNTQYQSIYEDRNLICVRGDLIPFIRLREIFELPGQAKQEEAVVVNFNDSRLGLVVDHIIGDHQTVIKSLGKVYEDIEGVSAATIMGDGSVALILDVAGLVRYAEQEEKSLVVH